MAVKIMIEVDDVDDLKTMVAGWLCDRDGVRDRLNELEREPLRFSLAGLAKRVVENGPGLTPSQADSICELIKTGARD